MSGPLEVYHEFRHGVFSLPCVLNANCTLTVGHVILSMDPGRFYLHGVEEESEIQKGKPPLHSRKLAELGSNPGSLAPDLAHGCLPYHQRKPRTILFCEVYNLF